MMALIDAHAHLCDEAFHDDLGQVLERAREAGVVRIVCVGETLEDAERNLELAEKYEILAPAAGLYPTYLDNTVADLMIEFIRQHRDRLVAIGEVGLDRWKVKDEEGRGLQEDIFRRFVRLSLELDIPLNIHSRSAGRHALAVLEQEGAERVLMHAFDGKASAAEKGIELGFYFSIPPSIVRSRQKQKLAARLPMERLLLETDSPVLGPVPGERNEPASARIPAEYLAEIKGLSLQEVAHITSENASTLFGFSPKGG